MRQSLVILASAFFAPVIACLAEDARIVRVDTDYADGPSNVSTDEIYYELKDGSKKYLTRNNLMDRGPAFSADNRYIAFYRRRDSNNDGRVDRSDRLEHWLIDRQSDEMRRINIEFEVNSFSWHPRRPEMCFIVKDEGDTELWKFDLKFGKHTKIISNARSWPRWSPNGKLIAFYNHENCVCTVQPDGRNLNVISTDVGRVWGLYWTTDNRLFFAHDTLGSQLYGIDDQSVQTIDEAAEESLPFVDQNEFDWAARLDK